MKGTTKPNVTIQVDSSSNSSSDDDDERNAIGSAPTTVEISSEEKASAIYISEDEQSTASTIYISEDEQSTASTATAPVPKTTLPLTVDSDSNDDKTASDISDNSSDDDIPLDQLFVYDSERENEHDHARIARNRDRRSPRSTIYLDRDSDSDNDASQLDTESMENAQVDSDGSDLTAWEERYLVAIGEPSAALAVRSKTANRLAMTTTDAKLERKLHDLRKRYRL